MSVTSSSLMSGKEEFISKKVLKNIVFFAALILASFAVGGQEKAWDFEDIPVGRLPSKWKIEGTNQKGPLAAWRIIADNTAPAGEHVLALTSTNHKSGGTFNICWTDSVQFGDGEIEVVFKADKGSEDQGGGIIWRVKDANNYYLARANPLENNFRLYYVKNGSRITLDSKNVDVPAKKWHIMKIVQKGTKIEAYLNGVRLLEKEDNTLNEAGGVGVWTKADAMTSFDNFKVKLYDKENIR